MIKVSFLTVISACLAFPAAAQVPGGGATTRGVVDACLADDAACRQAMSDYVDDVRSSGAQGEAFDQGVADLVVALATVASEDGECNESDRRLGLAISQSSSFATNASQRGQIDEIAQAVTACAEIQTAAISPIDDGPAGDAAGRGAASPN